jgi:fermentation-respiration switch protein FrsA (DUF1100 family)
MRYLYKFLRIAFLSYVGILAVLMFFENSLIWVPQNFKDDNWSPTGMKIEEAHIDSTDGVKLHGWYLAHEHPLAVVLFCHGNSGNVTHRAEIMRLLHDRTGVSVLVFDYRGFGRSTGSCNERGALADARAARKWLAQKAGVQEPQIVLMGESIGGAVAVDLAADGARALILENTFSSLPDVAAYHFPWVPVRLLMRTKLDSATKIKLYKGPLYQTHGEPDSIVPTRFGRKLFEAANEPKHFVLYPGRDHNAGRPLAYYDDLRGFLEKLGAK